MTTVESPQVTDPETVNEEPLEAHIVARGDDGTDPHTLLTEAIVNGTPVMALCGKIWVPSRDPKNLPLCRVCEAAMLDIIEMRIGL